LIRVIDIETTGTDPATDEIIEITSADMVRGGDIPNAMDTLVRPARPIPPGASAVHHLIDEDVQNAGRNSTGTATRSSATPSGAPRPFLASSAPPSRRTGPRPMSSSPPPSSRS
jgi:DNA polymerase III epsilon subunit-like protein